MNSAQRRKAYRKLRRLMRSRTPVTVSNHIAWTRSPGRVVTHVAVVFGGRRPAAQVIVPPRWNGDRGERIVHTHNLREVPRHQRFNYEEYRHAHT